MVSHLVLDRNIKMKRGKRKIERKRKVKRVEKTKVKLRKDFIFNKGKKI